MVQMAETLKHQVFRIDKTPTHGSDHESWSMELDAVFSTESEAREYVIRMNRRYCGYELGILYSKDNEVIADRCTNPNWCQSQRYFVGKPNIDIIVERLRKEGVNVIRRSQSKL